MPDSAALELLSQGTQKRARAQLSCVACRQGKLKCNRQQPACDQCIKRNKDASCTYVAAPQRKKPNQSMRDRIKHLESLVVELYNSNHSPSEDSPQTNTDSSNGTKSTNTSPGSVGGLPANLANHPAFNSENEEHTRAFGRMNIGKTETKYVSPAHWEAILDNIAEVRTALDDDEPSTEEHPELSPVQKNGATQLQVQSLLHPNPFIKTTREDIIKAIPPKSRTDAMVALYFNSQSPSVNIVHGPTFQKQYIRFWQKADDVSITWIALFLSVLAIAARLDSHDLSRSDAARPVKGSSSPETQRLQSLCASALLLAPYTRPTTHTIEALVCYGEGEYAEGDENHLEVWLLLGVTLRLALRMGYHRDAEHARISAFEGEMRRRSWCLLYAFDILLSFELGLPSMMLQMQFDVKLPSNLLDLDFGPEMKELPPSRPDSEYTNISYIRTKMRLSRIFGRAAEISHGVTATPSNEVLELDKRLNEVHDSMPPHLRVKPVDECLADPRGLIMLRFNLELLFQKTRCLLHRRFLTDTASNEFMEYSRTNCIDAALRILRQLATVDQAFEAGMMPHGWYIASLNTHDFLLAAMVIALDLDRRSKEQADSQCTETELRENQEMRNLLETAYQIWQKPIHRSSETVKASKVLLLMLARINKTSSNGLESGGNKASTPSNGVNGNLTVTNPMMQMNPVMQVQSTLTGLPTPGEMPTNIGLTPEPMEYVDMDFAPIGNMFDTDMDWQTWDNYIFNSNGGTIIPRITYSGLGSGDFDLASSMPLT